jgi:hypothetical protein
MIAVELINFLQKYIKIFIVNITWKNTIDCVQISKNN